MTDPNYTHITLVCDRSGSMNLIRQDAEGAVNSFLDEQRPIDHPCSLYMVEFDAGGGDWFRTVHDGPMTQAPRYTLRPRGNTALLDAVGLAITQTGEKLSSLSEEDRPGAVIFLIQTDGQENSSREWTWAKVQEAIKLQTEVYGWEFVFLGTGPDAWDQGSKMGIQYNTAGAAGADAFVAVYHNASSAVASRRQGNLKAMASTNVDVDKDGNVKPRL